MGLALVVVDGGPKKTVPQVGPGETPVLDVVP
jgi:hypothetical protein